MNGFLIERLTTEKISEVAKLDKLCFSLPWSEKSFELLCDGKNVGFVAVNDGEVVAYGGMLVVLDEGQITNIAVHPSYRRQGLGERIVSSLLEYGKEKQLSNISLEVRESNTAAKALYEKLGFLSVGVRKNFYSFPTENAIVMIKNIG
jgi:ribosomal-protein-alanine N-acetyltransferase